MRSKLFNVDLQAANHSSAHMGKIQISTLTVLMKHATNIITCEANSSHNSSEILIQLTAATFTAPRTPVVTRCMIWLAS